MPQWVQVLVERLCTDVVESTALPHVEAGVRVVLTQSPPPLPSNSNLAASPKKDKVAALAIAISFLVQARIVGGEATVKTISTKRKAALELANKGEHNADGQEDITEADVDEWMKELYSRGWVKLPWYKDIETEYTSRSSTGSQDDDAILVDSQEDQQDDEGGHEEAEVEEEGQEDEVPSPPATRQRRGGAGGSHAQTWRKEIVEPGLNTMVRYPGIPRGQPCSPSLTRSQK